MAPHGHPAGRALLRGAMPGVRMMRAHGPVRAHGAPDGVVGKTPPDSERATATLRGQKRGLLSSAWPSSITVLSSSSAEACLLVRRCSDPPGRLRSSRCECASKSSAKTAPRRLSGALQHRRHGGELHRAGAAVGRVCTAASRRGPPGRSSCTRSAAGARLAGEADHRAAAVYAPTSITVTAPEANATVIPRCARAHGHPAVRADVLHRQRTFSAMARRQSPGAEVRGDVVEAGNTVMLSPAKVASSGC